MSWLSSIGVALLTAAVGTIVTGYVANLAVGWYRVSSFEGGSGYFVVGFALLGLIGGFAIGLVVARVIAAGAAPSFLRALGLSLAAVLVIVGVVGGTSRALADVPPEIDGEQLMLAVELRWPASQTASPTHDSSNAKLSLGSLSGRVQRVARDGMLWTEDAHQVDGRWVAPGAVELFTTRGTLALLAELDSTTRAGFILPFKGAPSAKELQWSEWLPHPHPGAPALPDGFTYRFRVVKRNAPVRVESFGPFEIATNIHYFFDAAPKGTSLHSASSEFTLTYRGQPLVIEGPVDATEGGATARFAKATDVAALGGSRPALLVRAQSNEHAGVCYVVRDDGSRARVEFVAACEGSGLDATVVTSDTTRFRAARSHAAPRGFFDRTSFADGGTYLFHHALLDTQSLGVRRFEKEPGDDLSLIPDVPPLCISPDGRSFVRFGNGDDTGEHHVLIVTDVGADSIYTVPIDPARMRYASFDALDPAWVAHHFVWTRSADGVDRLVERPGFAPLPHQGTLATERSGFVSYRLEPAGEPMRQALIEFLVRELHGERRPADSGAYSIPVRIEGRTVDVSASSDSHYVLVSTPLTNGPVDPANGALVAEIAKRFDAALTTGKYDSLFGR